MRKKVVGLFLSLIMLCAYTLPVFAEPYVSINGKDPEVIDYHFGDPAYNLPSEETETFTIPADNSTNYSERTIMNNGTYYIRNKRTGKFLTAADNGVVKVSDYTGSANQRWELVNGSDVFFMLHPQSGGARDFLDINGSYSSDNSTNTYLNNGTDVQIFDNGSYTCQSSQWAATQTGTNEYLILAKMSFVFNDVYYDVGYSKYLTCEPGLDDVFQRSSYTSTNGSSHWIFEHVAYTSSTYEGFLDEVNDNEVRGWAYDPYNSSQHISVRINIQNESGVVMLNRYISASQYRADLEAAGKGDGTHAFSFNISNYPSGTYTVRAFAHGTGELVGSCKVHTINRTNLSETEYYSALGWLYPLRSGQTVDYWMSAPYAYSTSYGSKAHSGIDVGGGRYGEPVYSPTYGEVVAADFVEGGGYRVVIRTKQYVQNSNERLGVVFYHLQSNLQVGVGTIVTPETIVGYVGNSGGVDTHLHISVVTRVRDASTYTLFGDTVMNPRRLFPLIPFYGSTLGSEIPLS